MGAGFRIALRDLELRGAGNLLGSEQSGHVAGVGFELYCRLLKESVSRLKGEEHSLRPSATVRLDFTKILKSLRKRPMYSNRTKLKHLFQKNTYLKRGCELKLTGSLPHSSILAKSANMS